jgi:hypothetical protein
MANFIRVIHVIYPVRSNAPLGFESRYSGTGISNGVYGNALVIITVARYFQRRGEDLLELWEPLIIPNLSLPPRNEYGVNSGGSPVISKAYGFLLEFIPMKIGAGITFLEVALSQ